MAITQEDLHNFQQFADKKLADGSIESLQEILDAWNTRQKYQQSVAGIRESVSQYEAGEGTPVEKALDAVRRKLVACVQR